MIYKQMIDVKQATATVADSLSSIEKTDKDLFLDANITFSDMSKQKVFSITFNDRFNNRAIFMEKYAEISSKLEEYNLTSVGNLWVLSHDNYNASFSWEEGDVEVCIPIEDKVKDCPFVRTMPKFLALVADLHGTYEAFPDLYDRIDWHCCGLLECKKNKIGVKKLVEIFAANPAKVLGIYPQKVLFA